MIAALAVRGAHELDPESSLLKPIIVELKTTQVITLYSNNMATYPPVFPRHQQEWQDQESSEAHLVWLHKLLLSLWA